MAGIEAGCFDFLIPLVVAFLEHHDLDAMDGIGGGALVADNRRARLGPFDYVRAAGVLAAAVIGEHEAVIVSLALAVVRIVHAAQAGNELVQGVVSALKLIHIVGRALPRGRYGVESEHGKDGYHANDKDGEQEFDNRERPARGGALRAPRRAAP